MLSWKGLALIVLVFATPVQSDTGGGSPEKTPSDPFEKGKSLATREQWRDALAQFRAFLGSHADDAHAPEARFWVGYCLMKSGNYSEAALELTPFQAGLAKDRWADDALLLLGRAYQHKGDTEPALATWQRLVENYPDSVWRIEAQILIIDELFNTKKDYEGCLGYCQRVVDETVPFAAITEARYIGAYCLNALGRVEDADRWMDRWFAPDVAVESAWRGVLSAQRALSSGRTSEAFATIGSLYANYPDIDGNGRLDLTLRAASMLTREKQASRARTLLIDTLRQSSERPEADIVTIVDQIEATASDSDPVQATLDRLGTDISLPLVARVVIRDRQVKALRAQGNTNQAEVFLRASLAKEKAEYARFRAAMLLGDLLSVERNRAEAVTMLKGILPTLRRFDLANRVRDEIQRLQPEPETKPESTEKTKP